MAQKKRLNSRFSGAMQFSRSLYQRVVQEDLQGMASELAFNVLVSLVPIIVVIVSFLALNNKPGEVNFITDLVGRLLPGEVYQPINRSVENLMRMRDRGIFTVGLLVSILGCYTLFSTVHKLDARIHGRPAPRILSAPLYTFRLFSVVAFTVLALINLAFYFLKLDTYLMGKYRFFWINNHLRIMAPFYVAFAVTTLSGATYMFSAPGRRSFKEVLPGAALVGLIWLPVSAGFRWYIKFRSYGGGFEFAYFLLAQMLIMLLWIYLNTYLFLLGYALNSALDSARQERAGRG
jgi:membrane protein